MNSGECFKKCQKATRVRPFKGDPRRHLWVSLFSSLSQGHNRLKDVPREELFEVMLGTHTLRYG